MEAIFVNVPAEEIEQVRNNDPIFWGKVQIMTCVMEQMDVLLNKFYDLFDYAKETVENFNAMTIQKQLHSKVEAAISEMDSLASTKKGDSNKDDRNETDTFQRATIQFV